MAIKTLCRGVEDPGDHHAGGDDGPDIRHQDLPGQEQRQMPAHPEHPEQQRPGQHAETLFQARQGIAAEAGLLPRAAETRDEHDRGEGHRDLGP
jgi:hypothetical protein